MHSIKGEHSHGSIIERWQAIDEYFVCISECDLYDQVCIKFSEVDSKSMN